MTTSLSSGSFNYTHVYFNYTHSPSENLSSKLNARKTYRKLFLCLAGTMYFQYTADKFSSLILDLEDVHIKASSLS